MRGSVFLFCLLLLLACGGTEKQETGQPIPEPREAVFTAALGEGNIDLERSVIYWRGTKLRNTRHHEGFLKLKAGHLEIEDGSIRGGSFVADMATLQVTDIPAHETQARANLVKHLKSDFDAANFPYSQFAITSVRQAGSLQQVCGNLQIRDVLQEVCFETSTSGNPFTANLVLSRADWQIGADGSWLENRLVDDTFYLKVVLYVK